MGSVWHCHAGAASMFMRFRCGVQEEEFVADKPALGKDVEV